MSTKELGSVSGDFKHRTRNYFPAHINLIFYFILLNNPAAENNKVSGRTSYSRIQRSGVLLMFFVIIWLTEKHIFEGSIVPSPSERNHVFAANLC
jgi:hypothetical protein